MHRLLSLDAGLGDTAEHSYRSWNTVGLTLRLAYGQGLHIRNADVKLDNYQREVGILLHECRS